MKQPVALVLATVVGRNLELVATLVLVYLEPLLGFVHYIVVRGRIIDFAVQLIVVYRLVYGDVANPSDKIV